MCAVVHLRCSVAFLLGRPSPSPVATWKLYRDTRPNIPYRNREFSVATKDFEKSVATENYKKFVATKNSLSRHSSSVPPPRRNTFTVSQHKTSTNPVATRNQKDYVTREKPYVATPTTQSQPQPCCDTKVLSQHGAESLCRTLTLRCHERVPAALTSLSRAPRPGLAPGRQALSRHGSLYRNTGPKGPYCDRGLKMGSSPLVLLHLQFPPFSFPF